MRQTCLVAGNDPSVCRPDCGPPDAVLDAACVSSASGRGTRHTRRYQPTVSARGSCGGTWGLDPGRRRPCRRGRGVCLKNGVHRLQVIRPKRGQRFHGEGRTVLNGSRFLTTFSREGPILGGEWAKAARQEKWPLRQRRSCLQSPRGLLRRRQTARPGAEQRQRRAKPILF